MDEPPEVVIDVQADGNFVLTMHNLSYAATPTFGLRVSSQALSFGSPVFDDLFTKHATESTTNVIHLPDDDGNAMFLLCSILHLRNNALPHRIQADQLRRFALAAVKYRCVDAVGRATTMWFDNIYHSTPAPPALLSIEAAYLLDDPLYFARFTSRWVLDTAYTNNSSLLEMANLPYVGSSADVNAPHLLYLLPRLVARRAEALNTIRNEMELLIDPCAHALAEETQHYIDTPPGDSNDYDEDGNEVEPGEEGEDGEGGTNNIRCVVDREAATTYLSALRDAELWPSTRWSDTVSEVVARLGNFQAPKYDDSDKCAFCESVVEAFQKAYTRVRASHDERLWGLCLDCIGSEPGGVAKRCRLEHNRTGEMIVSAVGGGQLMITEGASGTDEKEEERRVRKEKKKT